MSKEIRRICLVVWFGFFFVISLKEMHVVQVVVQSIVVINVQISFLVVKGWYNSQDSKCGTVGVEYSRVSTR